MGFLRHKFEYVFAFPFDNVARNWYNIHHDVGEDSKNLPYMASCQIDIRLGGHGECAAQRKGHRAVRHGFSCIRKQLHFLSSSRWCMKKHTL